MSKKMLVPSDISNKILTIGPRYKNHRGGIVAVIEIYSKYFEQFNYIKSQSPGSIIAKTLIFLHSVTLLFIKLSFNRKFKIVHIHGVSYGSFYRKFVFFLLSQNTFLERE